MQKTKTGTHFNFFWLCLIMLVLLLLSSCQAREETGATDNPPDTSKEIVSLKFLPADNPSLEYTVSGLISDTNIAVTMPYPVALASLIPTITHNGDSVAPAGGVAQDFSSAVGYTVTAEDGSTQHYSVTVTVISNYQRSPAVIKDSQGTYWLFYAQADNTTTLADSGGNQSAWHTAVDDDTYTIYYRKSESLAELPGAPPRQLALSLSGRPSGFNQRELGAAVLGDSVYVFVSHGKTSNGVYYYKTSDSGSTWSGPTEILNGEGILHVHAKTGDLGSGERIYINGGQSGRGTVYEFDGSTVSGTVWEELSADTLAQTVVVDNGLYMIARTGTALKVWYNADFDATTDSDNTIADPVAASTWDHTLAKIGSTWYAIAAPETSMQFLEAYTSSSLSGPWSNQQLTTPGAGLWDYWPDLYVESGTGWLFHTSEKGGYGRIALLTLP